MPGVQATFRAGRVNVRGASAPRAGGAFTLVDVIVCVVIIAILVVLLLPSLTTVRETTRRVVCSSNARQHGLGFAMYNEDYHEFPASRYEPSKDGPPVALKEMQNMILARTDAGPDAWDGLGVLYGAGYLDAPQVFYCPSHSGSSPFSAYADLWRSDSGKIVINYQYRGAAPLEQPFGDKLVVLADGLRTKSDYSHKVGSNVLRGDYSVSWVPDRTGAIARALPDREDEADAGDKVEEAWEKIDEEAAKDQGK